jgi:DNA-binding LytR/AlgR family response regulator
MNSSPPSTRLCAVVAEDEALLAQHLTALLARLWPELQLVVAHNGPDALLAIEREDPQLVFLDIRMPGMTGLEVAAELTDRRSEQDRVPQLIFVTAYGEFALEAFDLAAVDYLLKPVSEQRLAQCIVRCKQRLSQPISLETLVAQLQQASLGAVRPQSQDEPLRIIRAGSGDTVTMVPLEDVCYFRASDKYTTVITQRGEALIRTPLKELLARLPATRFAQIHRNAIVNLDEVAAAVRDAGGRVALELKRRPERLLVSRIHAERFRQM